PSRASPRPGPDGQLGPPTRDEVSGRRLPYQEDRYLAVAQDVLGRAAEYHLDDARVAVGPAEEQVVAAFAQRLGSALVSEHDHRLAAELEPVRLQVAACLVEHLSVGGGPVAHDVDDGER